MKYAAGVVRGGLDFMGRLERKGSGGKKLVYDTKSALRRVASGPCCVELIHHLYRII